jgi:EAL domain-containing protein (putative c-di-GMP-specific phosphodiesterase class I)
VETEEQRAILIREGCKEIQGYLISRPHTIDHFSDLTECSAKPSVNGQARLPELECASASAM